MTEPTTRFSYPLKVRYSEIDQQGIVYNAHYLTYFDIGVHEFFHSLPYDYAAIGKRTGFDFNMAKGVVEYHRPMRLDEEFAVEVDVKRVGRSSLTFALALRVGDEPEPRASGEIVSVHADQRSNRSSPLPDDLLALLAARGFSRAE
ncbi:MAG: acyl-CoA thioesterase [Geminicoccaceae bacterium]